MNKRIVDFLVAFLGLLFISPIFILVAILSFISTRYYPIFPDSRVGKNGKLIKVYKFRTMYKDAETNIRRYLNEEQIDQWELERKVPNDPRVTRIGKILRKTSLDEIPQLINIIVGDMSFVGPRPITKREIKANFTKTEQEILTSVRPGLTGMWQVYGRAEETWASGNRKKYDQKYLEKRSFFFDAKIFILTIPSCIKFIFQKQR